MTNEEYEEEYGEYLKSDEYKEFQKKMDDWSIWLKTQTCSIEGCKGQPTGTGEGKPYCHFHFTEQCGSSLI